MIAKIYKKLYRRFEKPERFYKIDGFSMDLGEGHMLSLTQKYNLMYDRFIPFLAEMVKNKNNWIIDIGANVGDTAAAMIKHTNGQILCVEPTLKFYKLLEKNINNFGIEYVERIKLVNSYISNENNTNYTSVLLGGTAIMKEVKNSSVPSMKLPDLFEMESINLQDVEIIKSDTDGFDSDCIMSMGNYLFNISPVLYWENQIDTDEQFNKFLNMADYLYQNNYNNFYVFDNYGNYLLKTDYKGLKNISYYINRIRNGKTTYTFRYVDVLGCKDDKTGQCEKAIEEYLKVYG